MGYDLPEPDLDMPPLPKRKALVSPPVRARLWELSDFREVVKTLVQTHDRTVHALIARGHIMAVIPLADGLRRRVRTNKYVPTFHLIAYTTTPRFDLQWEKIPEFTTKNTRLNRVISKTAWFVPYGEERSGWRAYVDESVLKTATRYGLVVHDGSGTAADIRADLAALLPMMDDLTTIVLLEARRPEVDAVWHGMIRRDGWSSVQLGRARNMAVLQRLPLPIPAEEE